MKRICKKCSKAFNEYPSQIKVGRGKYCSRKCQHEDRHEKSKEVKICLACGKKYEVGGRQRKGIRGSRNARLCSDECQRKARYRKCAMPNKMSNTEKAYLAGLIDGEGSIMLQIRKGKVISTILSITNTDMDMLNWVKNTTGVGNINKQYDETEKRSASWFWRANGGAGEDILKQIFPFLITKKVQANLAIETQERLRNPALKADRLWQEEYRLKMKDLNKRGPN